MAVQRLFVSPDGLDAGANRCDEASASASSGADVLGGVAVEFGIFGDFDAAHDFHRTAKDIHDQHIGRFAEHAERLAAIAGKSERSAQAFTGADQQSRELIDRQVHYGG